MYGCLWVRVLRQHRDGRIRSSLTNLSSYSWKQIVREIENNDSKSVSVWDTNTPYPVLTTLRAFKSSFKISVHWQTVLRDSTRWRYDHWRLTIWQAMVTYVSMGRIDNRGQLMVFLATPLPPKLLPPHTSLTRFCPANLPHSFAPGPICQAIPPAL